MLPKASPDDAAKSPSKEKVVASPRVYINASEKFLSKDLLPCDYKIPTVIGTIG